MPWIIYLAHFGAGLFLANGVPHFVNGISGRKFQTPFASPPAVGESSPVVNVTWGLFNLAIGYVLLSAVGPFQGGLNLDTLAVFVGALLVAIGLASHFHRVREGGKA